VPSLSRETLRGYVLEELLAKLIQNTGYSLLVDESQDPEELENRSNGLCVRGRGGTHQVDVLGELAWIPAFTFPLRLIIEAKARGTKTGIGAVRNAVGVISDVNQNLARIRATEPALLQKFSYRYALFSTAGFSGPAADYALAHQISLIDLSAAAFADIVGLADDVTSAVSGDYPPRRAGGFVREFRRRLRRALKTWPYEVPLEIGHGHVELDRSWPKVSAMLDARLDAIGDLFVGMANGPYLLLLRARNPRHVIEVFEREPVQDVAIHWNPDVEGGALWTVTLAGRGDEGELHFALPDAVAEWIFDPEADARRRAIQFKEQFLSTITIYRFVGGQDRLYRLRFSRAQVSETWPGRRRRR
jgi:hypothetical protein